MFHPKNKIRSSRRASPSGHFWLLRHVDSMKIESIRFGEVFRKNNKSLLIKFYNLKCKLGSFLLQLIKTVQWQNWFTFLSLWMWEKTPPQKNRTLFTFFLMILMMNRPDGSLSFLLTLSKTLFLNREHDLFLKKTNKKTKLFITSQQTGMTILTGFLFICFQITKTLIFFFRFDSFLEP